MPWAASLKLQPLRTPRPSPNRKIKPRHVIYATIIITLSSFILITTLLIRHNINHNRYHEPIKPYLPNAPSSHLSHHHPLTLVVYSGPTNIDSTKGKNDLYLKNFDYYLTHGLDCSNNHDTIIILTPSVADHYSSQLSHISSSCVSRYGRKVTVAIREDRCWDMESMRVIRERVSREDLSHYEYFVYVNCGVVGPKIDRRREGKDKNPPWTSRFTSLLSPRVKMAGLSINCAMAPHVQSFLFVLDRVGLSQVMNSTAIFDCRDNGGDDASLSAIIERYEVGMSQVIFDAGFGIAAVMSSLGPLTVYPKTRNNYHCHDMWVEKQPGRILYNAFPRWEETMFFKVSRFVPEYIVDEMGYLNYLI